MSLIDFDYWMEQASELVDMAHELTVKYGGDDHGTDSGCPVDQGSGNRRDQ